MNENIGGKKKRGGSASAARDGEGRTASVGRSVEEFLIGLQ